MEPGRRDYEKELESAVRAAREAAGLIRERAGRVGAENVREKALNDLVTETDEAAQQIIIRVLRETFPDSDFLAEEGEVHADGGPVRGRQWIIDPIDGTTNFTRGVPPYAVSIAMRHDGRLTLGVVLDVAHDELFTAVRARGLFVDGERRHVSRTETLGESLVTTGFPYRELRHVERYLDVLGEFMRHARGVRRPGSASVDLAWVACGRFDGFFETGLRPWDVAAGTLLVREAGGRVTDYRNEHRAVSGEQIVASNGRIHDEMIEILARMQDVHL